MDTLITVAVGSVAGLLLGRLLEALLRYVHRRLLDPGYIMSAEHDPYFNREYARPPRSKDATPKPPVIRQP